MCTRLTASWQLFSQNPSLSETLAGQLRCHPVVAQILLNRNIRSMKDAYGFLHPPDEGFFQHFLQIPQLESALSLVASVVAEKRSVLLAGDYDVDGISSTAMFWSFFKKMGVPVSAYIPHRMSEGYGLNINVIHRAIRENIGLLITLDCGISNATEIAALKTASACQVLILDHHQIPEKMPSAEAILNPKFLEKEHPHYNLCTAALAYQFLRAYREKFQVNLPLDNYLELATLGTIADVMPLTGENRAIVKKGLTKLATTRQVGIRALLEAAGFDRQNVTVRDVGFVIAPRLNAAGRIRHAQLGLALLTEEDAEAAKRQATELESVNFHRREIGDWIYKNASEMLAKNPSFGQSKALVVSSTEWHAGVIGITAAQLVRETGKPAILIATGEEMGRGSARSAGGVDIYKVLKEFSEYFVNFGGHKEAAGFSILPENIPGFEDAFRARVGQWIQDEDLVTRIDVDAVLKAEEMTLELAECLECLAPFGQGNPAPIFYTNALKPVDFRTVGNGSHLKARFSNQAGTVYVDAIGFGLANKLDVLYKPRFELLFHLETNSWQGVTVPQLQMVDLK